MLIFQMRLLRVVFLSFCVLFMSTMVTSERAASTSARSTDDILNPTTPSKTCEPKTKLSLPQSLYNFFVSFVWEDKLYPIADPDNFLTKSELDSIKSEIDFFQDFSSAHESHLVDLAVVVINKMDLTFFKDSQFAASNYAETLRLSWKIGKKQNNGMLIFVSVVDKAVAISVGERIDVNHASIESSRQTIHSMMSTGHVGKAIKDGIKRMSYYLSFRF